METRLDARLREIPPSAVHALLLGTAEIDELKGWWRGREHPAPAPVLGRQKRRVARISAEISTRMSGRGHAGGGREAGPSALEAPLAAGYEELLRDVFDGHRDMAFGEELVLRFHGRLFRHSPPDASHRGAYKTAVRRAAAPPRRDPESPALRPSDPHMAPLETRAAVAWAASRLAGRTFHPLLVIAAFLLEFLAIRPFADGNGRLSRILANLLLLQGGYAYVPYASLDRAIASRRMEYEIALRRAQAGRNLPRPDISPWLLAFLDALRAQAGELRETFTGKPPESLLSENQLAVLDLFRKHREVTNRIVRRELGLPRETAKQVFTRLASLDLVRRAGAGRAARYRRAPLQGETEPPR